MKHVTGVHGAAAKKSALFDVLHQMQTESVAEAKALGATDAQLEPFTKTQILLASMKAQIVAVDLN
jgi:hypothetical protein